MERLKLQTPVELSRSRVEISTKDRIVVLGSCFADNVGGRMAELGFDVCVNPFGTLYNPVSVCNSAARLESGVPFSRNECVQMGAGAGMVCSFSHHTSFARRTEEEFLENANASLKRASEQWKASGKVLVTLGTAWCFEHKATGMTVANCLKVDAAEFSRRRLSAGEATLLLKNLVGRHPDKEFIFTVSPSRHFKDGAHGNQVSKSVLILAVEETLEAFPSRTDYFPAYEIVMDELRDYRFYAPDMVHPSEQTVGYLWERFAGWAVPVSEAGILEERRRRLLSSRHRPIIG